MVEDKQVSELRLLFVTFALDSNHPSLSWQLDVARELADRVRTLTVVTSYAAQGERIPDNMDVVIPPVRPFGVPHRYGGRWFFNLDVYRLCRKRGIDAVFIHMAKNWAYQLKPALTWLGAPVVLWYAHGTVTWSLRAAALCVDRIVTSTPDGCRLKSREKIRVIGQAIDVRSFVPPETRNLDTVLYVGRISRRKRVDLIYEVAKSLVAMDSNVASTDTLIVGSSRTLDDLRYEYELRSRLWKEHMENSVEVSGHVPHERLPEFYKRAFVHLNVSETGSMDKSVMEALAAGCPVLTSNTAFKEILRKYPEFIIADCRPEAIAEQIGHIHERRMDYDPWELRALVTDQHSLDTYADRVLQVLMECTA